MSRYRGGCVRCVHSDHPEGCVRNGTALVLVVLMALIILAAVVQLIQSGGQ